MKKIFSAAVLSILIFTASAQRPDHKSIAAREARAAQAMMHPGSNASYGNYDLKYHRFEWEVDPAVFYIQGSVTPW